MPDANALIQRAREIGILTLEDFKQSWDELGTQHPSPLDLLRNLRSRGLLTSLQMNKLERGEKGGYFYGPNKILYKIASGGFARVYRGINIVTGEDVAVKVLRRRWTNDPASVQAFLHEGKVGEKLRHPNIVRVDEVGQISDADTNEPIYFMAMEFIEGGNLKNFLTIRNGKVEEAEAPGLMIQMLEGLAHAFEQNITHRDIKLTNILAGSDGVMKLVDFGLATVHRSVQLAEEAHGQRTVEYAELEKTTGAPNGDPRSDIFFLGAIFYQMISGVAPFPERKDRTSRMLKARVNLAKRLVDAAPHVATEMSQLVDRMMALNPKRRYQTPHDVLRDLTQEKQSAAADLSSSQDGQPTILLVETNTAIQNAVRTKLQAMNYRVLITADPNRALAMFGSKAIHCVIVDCETIGRKGLNVFQEMEREAMTKNRRWAGIVMLAAEQDSWRDTIPGGDATVVLTKPTTLRDLRQHVQRLVPVRPRDAN